MNWYITSGKSRLRAVCRPFAGRLRAVCGLFPGRLRGVSRSSFVGRCAPFMGRFRDVKGDFDMNWYITSGKSRLRAICGPFAGHFQGVCGAFQDRRLLAVACRLWAVLGMLMGDFDMNWYITSGKSHKNVIFARKKKFLSIDRIDDSQHIRVPTD
jgi:hypothetical protein